MRKIYNVLGIFFILNSTAFTQQTFLISEGTAIKTIGGVTIVLEDTKLTNNAFFEQSAGDGHVRFSGEKNSSISGSGSTTIDHLIVNYRKNSRLLLNKNIRISSHVKFISGILDLQNGVIDLNDQATLLGESELSRTFTSGKGYVTATVKNASIANPGNLGAYISAKFPVEKIVVKRGHYSYSNKWGQSIQRYFEISTDNNQGTDVKLRFSYFNAELNSTNKSLLSIWSSKDGISWVDKGADNKDILSNYIEKTSISIASTYTLFPSNQMEDVVVWPNPVHEHAYLKITSEEDANIELLLFDVKGALIKKKKVHIFEGENNLTLDMKNEAAGTYYLHIKRGINNKSFPLIKK